MNVELKSNAGIDRNTFLRHFSNAQTYFTHKEYKEAFLEIKEAGKIDPDNTKLAYLTVELFKRANDAKGLIKICSHLLERDPDDMNIKTNLALGFYRDGNVPVAKKLIEAVLKEEKNIVAVEIHADCLYKERLYERAKDLYQTILNDVDNPARILVKLSACYFKLNDAKNTAATTGRLLELGYKDQQVLDLYNKALEAAKQQIGLEHRQSFWQKLFTKGYDPVVAKFLNLELEKTATERRLDVEKRKNYTDTLTQINNRNYFDEVLAPMFIGSDSACLIHFDLDHFKDINDTYGHKAGDAVLIEFAAMGKSIFTQAKDGSDYQTFCRYGGEEFLAVFFGNKDEAFKKADAFRWLVQGSLKGNVKDKHGFDTREITISAGIASFPTEAADFKDLYLIADKRLYAAKEQGRNQIIKND
jgi:diguanylate cyclase (GGDEF)-like protein